jgi:hypothetical protein
MGEFIPKVTTAVELVIGAGRPQTTGSFRFWFADERWEWSDEVAAIHGYRAGEVCPTTELLLSHKHPEDRAQVASTIAESVENAQPFCSRHRLIDTAGQEHQVIVVGDCMVDDDDTVIGTTGYYVDLTSSFREQRQEVLDDTLPELYEARAVIEQAKGVVMFVYRITAEQAFGVLKWRSQETNTKLRALAAQLLVDLGAIPGSPTQMQTQFDHLLLTVHERIPSK